MISRTIRVLPLLIGLWLPLNAARSHDGSPPVRKELLLSRGEVAVRRALEARLKYESWYPDDGPHGLALYLDSILQLISRDDRVRHQALTREVRGFESAELLAEKALALSLLIEYGIDDETARAILVRYPAWPPLLWERWGDLIFHDDVETRMAVYSLILVRPRLPEVFRERATERLWRILEVLGISPLESLAEVQEVIEGYPGAESPLGRRLAELRSQVQGARTRLARLPQRSVFVDESETYLKTFKRLLRAERRQMEFGHAAQEALVLVHVLQSTECERRL